MSCVDNLWGAGSGQTRAALMVANLLPGVSNTAANKTQRTKVNGCVKAHSSILYVTKHLSFYDHLSLQQELLVDLIC